MLRIRDLQALKHILNITQICKMAGLQNGMILHKIRTGTELRIDESEKISEVFGSFGLNYLTEYNGKLKQDLSIEER